MTVLVVIMSIILWFLVGIGFARCFRLSLAEVVDSTAGMGWWFILFWPLWVLSLLINLAMDSRAPLAMLGDRLAGVLLTQVDDPTSHDRVLAAVAAAEAQISQHPSAGRPPDAHDGPFVLEGGKIRPARKAQEDISDGTKQ